MDGILLSARLVLAAVFLVAGLAKLADRDGAREATRAFGAPEAIAGPVSAILILAELAAAALLIPSATAIAGAALAAALLLAFCVGITRSMLRGEAPDCHCFGQLHSAPAGPKTLARNGILAAVALLIVAGGAGTSATAWVAGLSQTGVVALIAGVVLAVILGAGAALALSVLRRHGQLLLRIDALEDALALHGIEIPQDAAPEEGLPVGTPAPDFTAEDLDGATIGLGDLLTPSLSTLLVFTDPACGPCSALLPQLGEWQREHRESLRIVLLSRGERDANLAHAREHGLDDVLLQSGREVDERYSVSGTPSAVLVSADGTIDSAVHAGADAITQLISSRLAAPVLPIHQHEPAPSGPAPDVSLRTLKGAKTMLRSRLSTRTAVIFWRPTCGFCERMLPDLLEFEAAPPPGSPELLVISTGTVAENLQMGLRATILLDDSFAAGTAFGAGGTPSAVLVEDGEIASHVAVGADEVLALLGAGAQLRVA